MLYNPLGSVSRCCSTKSTPVPKASREIDSWVRRTASFGKPEQHLVERPRSLLCSYAPD